MTLPATPRKAGPFTGTGVQTDFPFTFKVFDEDDVRVVLADVDGIETDQVITTDYTVALNPDQDTSPGGTITMLTAPATGERLVLLGDIDFDQPFDIPDGGGLRTVALENQLDRTIMQLQQLLERLGRTVRLASTGALQDLVFPQPSQGDLIGWNNTSDTLTNYDPLDILQLAGSSGFQFRTFTGNGVLTDFDLAINPGSVANLFVYLDGVRQTPVTDYGFNLEELQFVTPPPNGVLILAVFGETLGIGIPAFGSVTSDKLDPLGVAIPIGSTLPSNIVGRPQLADAAVGTDEIENLAVTSAKLGDLSVTTQKLDNGAVTGGKLSVGAVSTINIGDDQVTYAKMQPVALQSILGNPGTVAADAREIGISTGFSYRNRVINGGANVAQRAGAVYTSGVAGYSGPDRFNAANLTAGGQFTQSQGSLTVENVAEATVRQVSNSAPTSLGGGNAWSGILQIIEGFNCYDLIGKPVTLSFVFNTNLSGTYTVALRDATGTRSYVTTFAAVAGVPLRVVVPIPAIPTVANIPRSIAAGLQINIGALNNGTFQTSPSTAWQVGNFINSNTATNWGATVNAAIEVTQLQLEQGPINTPFERLPYSSVLAQCQRYYFSGAVTAFSIATGAGQETRYSYAFPVAMRTSPTTAWPGAGTNLASSLSVNSNAYKVDIQIVSAAAGSFSKDSAVLTADAEL